MLKPKVEKDKNWILAGRGSINLPPVVNVPRTLPPFNMGSPKNAKPIQGQGNK